MDQAAELTPARAELEQRVRRAMEDLNTRRIAVEDALHERDEAIAELRLAGATIDELASLTGLSVGLISSIGSSRGITSKRTVTRTGDPA